MANLISLGGVELTDQGRTFSESSELKKVDVELANGGTKRYYKAGKRKFSLNWTWAPDATAQTFDAYGARDAIRTLVYTGTSLVLIIRNHPTDLPVTYTVLIESYSENLLRRDVVSGVYFWELSLELMEV